MIFFRSPDTSESRRHWDSKAQHDRAVVRDTTGRARVREGGGGRDEGGMQQGGQGEGRTRKGRRAGWGGRSARGAGREGDWLLTSARINS